MWSKTCQYGMMICGRLAEMPDGEYTSVKQLEQNLGIASCVLAKVVQRLTRVGILESLRGPHGGVRLGDHAERLPIRHLADVLDDLSWLETCPFHPESSPSADLCSTHHSWDSVRRSVLTFIDTTTIGDLKPTQELSPPSAGSWSAS